MKNPFRSAVRYRNGIPILPGDFPLLGHIPMLASLRDVLVALRQAKETVGPLFWISAPESRPILIWTEKESLELLRNKVTTSYIGGEITDVIAGNSIIRIDGAPHQHARSAMNGTFTPRGLSARRVGEVMAELIEARMRSWTDKREITVLTETQELALDIILRIMGIKDRDLTWWRTQYRGLFSIKFPGYPAYWARRARRRLEERLLEIINEARRSDATGEEEGLIAGMVHGRDEAGQALSDQELLDNLLMLVLAGHETTASTMAWVVLSLAGRPDLWEQLGAEAGRYASLPTRPQQIRELPIADGLFRETVRFYPPAPQITRVALEGLTVRNHPIPTGTLVSAFICLPLRDAEVYPDPDRFDPSRWVGRAPTPLETAPFGQGPHFCIGYHLAWLEVVQFAVSLAQTMARQGLRPTLEGGLPQPVWLPMVRPPAKTRVAFH
jgi:cytochrome P450 monooxygenase